LLFDGVARAVSTNARGLLRSLVQIACVASVGGWGVSARAQVEEVEAIRVVVAASRDCAADGGFAEQMFARTRRARPATMGDGSAREFDVSLRNVGKRVEGRLTIRASDGTMSDRRVTGRSCGDVVAALALVAALIVDPQASTKPVAALTIPAPAPAAPSVPTPLPPPVPTPPPPVMARVEVTSLPTPVPAVARWRFESDVGASVRTGIASEPAFGAQAGLGLAQRSTSWAALSVRTSFLVAQAEDATTREGTARFRWVLGRVGACVGGPRFANRLDVRGCAFTEGGALLADGIAVENPQSIVRPWVASGLGARIGWHITDRFGLEVEVAGLVPMLRDTFAFGPPSGMPTLVLPEVPAVSGSLSVGIVTTAP